MSLIFYLKKICHQIDSNGDFNVEVAKRVIKDNYAVQRWEQEASDRLVEQCTSDVAANSRQPINYFGFICNAKAAELAYCMWRAFFLTCPVDSQEPLMQCMKLRTVLAHYFENKFKN